MNEGKQTRRRRGDRSKGEIGGNRVFLVNNAKIKKDRQKVTEKQTDSVKI